MQEQIKRRALELAEYVASTGQTVRNASKKFGVSKSTVHKDLSERLPLLSDELYQKVRKVLNLNLSQRHIRGGTATKNKYLRNKNNTRSF